MDPINKLFPRKILLLLTLIFHLVTGGLSANSISKQSHSPTNVSEGNLVTEEGAWCWFADPRAVHHKNNDGSINNSYIGYIDVHGNIKATQHNFNTGVTNEVLVRSYFQPDDHDNPTFLVLPDERIMIFYSRHTDEACFYYRISTKPGDITGLGEEMKIITSANTTYPSPFILSDDPDHFYLTWRGINWHPTIARLTIPNQEDEVSVDWGPYQIVQSTGSRPYCKYASNGKDKIMMTYTTGHPDNESPNYVYYNYIDINNLQLKDIKGTVLKNITSGPLSVNKTTFPTAYPYAVVDKPSTYRDWVWQTAMDDDGNPVIAMVQISSDKSTHNYYYAKWTGSEWRKTFLANGGGRFHQTPGLELCYSGGMTIDDSHPENVYCSVPVTGTSGSVYEIIKYTIAADGSVESTEQITRNSSMNNARPYIITNSGDNPMKLVWMHGNYYDWIVSSSRPKGYPTAIHSDYPLWTSTVDLSNGLIIQEEFDQAVSGTAETKNGVLVSTTDTHATLAVEDAAAFTLSLSPYLYEGTYEGEILSMGSVKYGINGATLKPYVKVNDETYNSTNILGTSDVWQTKSRSTGGQWYTPTKHEYFNLSITYNGSLLKTFRNGLIDQVIEIEGLVLEDINLGGFNGWIEDCHIYNRELNQEEVKTLTETTLSYSLDDSMLKEMELASLSVPTNIYTDVLLPETSSSGISINWVSNNTAVLTNSGIITQPESVTNVTLTATIDGKSKDFAVKVWPRDISKNQIIKYTFESNDIFLIANERYVKDKSGKGRDAKLIGNCEINGVLDLTSNTSGGFSTNGYAIAPEGTLDSLRSFTFLAEINASSLNNLPRIFDFGSASSNSIFLRASGYTAGYKYNGSSTILVNSSTGLSANQTYKVALTFDAKTKYTKIFLDGVEKARSTAISYEPYQLTQIDTDRRNYIGRTQWWDTSVKGDNVDFKGTIDNVYFYNIALTPEEIVQVQSESTSMIAITDETPFLLYPNPVPRNQQFHLDFSPPINADKPYTIKIINLSGKLINEYRSTRLPFMLDGLDRAGVYFVHVLCRNKSEHVKKLIVI